MRRRSSGLVSLRPTIAKAATFCNRKVSGVPCRTVLEDRLPLSLSGWPPFAKEQSRLQWMSGPRRTAVSQPLEAGTRR